MNRVIDETGRVYGVVTVLRQAGKMGQSGHEAATWLCRCSVCGGTRRIRGTQLRRLPPKTCVGRCVK